MNSILPGVYQGSMESLKHLKQYKITHVITLCPTYVNLESYISHLDIPISDWGPISRKQLEECYDFIDECVKNRGNVLIHCFAGMNRSVSVTAAYLMYKLDLDWDTALCVIKKTCPIADPSEELKIYILRYFEKLNFPVKESCASVMNEVNGAKLNS